MKKRLFAHLCTWFSTPEVSGCWEMWNSNYSQNLHDPDKILENGRRDIAAFGYPLLGVYDSADRNAIRWQLSLMSACGIDGVIVDWDGRRINPHRHEKFLVLLEEIAAFSMKVIVCFEEWCGYYPLGTFRGEEDGVNAAIAELQWLKDNVIARGLYEEQDGKYPVLVFRKMPGHMFGDGAWKKIKESAAAENMQFYFENCYDDQIENAADGWFFWVGGFDKNNENSLTYFENARNQYEQRVKDIGNKPMVMSVVPGFDDTCVWGWGEGKRVAPRYGGLRYRRCWEHVIDKNYNFVQIVTWNDWNEGSHIEPSEDFGYEYLLETARFNALWKGEECNINEENLKRITEKFCEIRDHKGGKK